MASSFEFLEADGVLVVRHSGTYRLSDEGGSIERIATMLREHDCRRCLADYRSADFVAPTMAAYDRPQLFSDLGIDRSVRAAMVVRQINAETRFYEDVCINRGWNVRMFDDIDVAMAWLLQKPSPTQPKRDADAND